MATLAGCFSSEPEGIVTDKNGLKYYKIQLPAGATAQRYFGSMKQIKEFYVYSANGPVGPREIVYLFQVSAGGHIAYCNKNPNKIIYFSPGFSETRLQTVASSMTLGSDEYMTIKEAQKHVPILKK